MDKQNVLYHIRNVKVKNERPILTYREEMIGTTPDGDVDRKSDAVTRKGDRKVHSDFIKRMNNLKIHWLILCGYVDQDIINPDYMDPDSKDEASPYKHKMTERTTIHSVHISGNEDERKVIITGTFKNELDKAVNINSPLTNLDDDDSYNLQQELLVDVELLIDEVTQYITGKKDGEPYQLNLFDNPKAVAGNEMVSVAKTEAAPELVDVPGFKDEEEDFNDGFDEDGNPLDFEDEDIVEVEFEEDEDFEEWGDDQGGKVVNFTQEESTSKAAAH